MRLVSILGFVASCWAISATTSTQGLQDLVKRRLPSHSHDFVFVLNDRPTSNSTDAQNDEYSISTSHGKIEVKGNSVSALASGLRRYFTDVAHVDLYWFIGNRLDAAASPLPRPNNTITGQSIVPWRYFFNTVTFSYTTAFWSWKDWELELDWLALHGVNLPLAWVGFEKILLDVFRDVNLTTAEIIPFFSGPAFQSWNRFGNIQGSWGGELPLQWIDSQLDLQKKILERMIELGMTPILPAFTGFVPRALHERYPNASVVNGSQWSNFPLEYTNTTFLEPADPLFSDLQKRVISKQVEYYGNITHFYTLDQYNENDPYSGDVDYLRNVTKGTWQSLKDANPAAVWVMQGWLFFSNSDFWTNQRIEAYLSGVEKDSDLLVLDLFSESQPQWQRTNSYYGKPWVWCELHDYGANMGLYGQVENVTVNAIEALHNSSDMVGIGATPEGQEGNEIMYAILLDQAWSSTPINTSNYFADWVRTRYAGRNSIPKELYTAWDLLRTSVYNNTHLAANAVPKAIFELAPNTTGLVNRTGHHPTQLNYPPARVVDAWKNMYAAAQHDGQLWQNPAFQHDLVDVTRQVFANEFLAQYTALIAAWNTTSPRADALRTQSAALLTNLDVLDKVLSTLPQFRLSTWIASARSLAPANNKTIADFYEYNARNQITQWGPDGEINDYASKSWGGLVGGYYAKRWSAFLGYLGEHGPQTYDAAAARAGVKQVEEGFQKVGGATGVDRAGRDLQSIIQNDVVPFLKRVQVL